MGGVMINTFDSCLQYCTSPSGSAAAAAGSSRTSKRPSRSVAHSSYRPAGTSCSSMIAFRMSPQAATSNYCIASISSWVMLAFQPLPICFSSAHTTRCKPSKSVPALWSYIFRGNQPCLTTKNTSATHIWEHCRCVNFMPFGSITILWAQLLFTWASSSEDCRVFAVGFTIFQ
jgi:hypothetical protein